MTATTISPDTTAAVPVRQAVRPIPTARLVKSELRKMFNTRSGLWMLISIGVLSVLATCAVIIFAPDDEVTYESFATAIGFPMSVILPMIAILGVTSEWSQRSGLTTFTLVPSRGRVIGAKAIATFLVGVVSMAVAFAVGALGNLLGATVTGNDLVWNLSFGNLLYIMLANVIGMMMGFMLGVLIRNSAGAVVGYFVFAFVLPTLSALLAGSQAWFRDLQPWVDVNFAVTRLFDQTMTAEYWQQLGVSTLVWLWIPLAIGLRAILRAEVK